MCVPCTSWVSEGGTDHTNRSFATDAFTMLKGLVHGRRFDWPNLPGNRRTNGRYEHVLFTQKFSAMHYEQDSENEYTIPVQTDTIIDLLVHSADNTLPARLCRHFSEKIAMHVQASVNGRSLQVIVGSNRKPQIN